MFQAVTSKDEDQLMPLRKGGCDHHPNGSGITRDTICGELDVIGYRAAVTRVPFHDVHATTAHLLGIVHKHLPYFRNGRRCRPTDVAGELLSKNSRLNGSSLRRITPTHPTNPP